MLQCLSGLNPAYCCLTPSDFEDEMLNIDNLLKQIDEGKFEAFQLHEQKVKHLEKTFHLALKIYCLAGKKQLDKQLAFLIAEILKYYGSLCYNDTFIGSKQILLIALNMHFYSIGLIDQVIDLLDFTSLEDLKFQVCAKPQLVAFMERIVLTTDRDQCVTQACKSALGQSYPNRRMLSIAQVCSKIGYCYQNIDFYCTAIRENNLRFAQLFSLSEVLLLLIDNPESQHELGDLYYQAWPSLYQRQHPQDIEGICALYNKALACDSSIELQIQVANMRFHTLFNANKKTQAAVYIRQALELAVSLKDNDHNKFLLAKVNSNYARHLMEPETLNLLEAEKHLLMAIQFADQCRSNGTNHLNFAIYDILYAEVKLLLGDFSIAKEIIERAIVNLKKFPESSHMYIGTAESLRAIINKTIGVGHLEIPT